MQIPEFSKVKGSVDSRHKDFMRAHTKTVHVKVLCSTKVFYKEQLLIRVQKAYRT